ncbi:TetR family transcriptional regulator [Clavibacter michiganensis]|uniref:TetR family transcriptional regulator n=1 Tax=Clavibacter michiganensis TaxID=28447 RepID=A0A251XSP1_9MICO|nr:TetR family transcriptional regulator C-terminal domain-containing protein [Clavibacter michiganensis]OUE08525.1 transcriptional regulator BetI [Clavibacter michiganensis]PPF63623.1 TetR family transcriptional regulator [Clavibacter michiganensis]
MPRLIDHARREDELAEAVWRVIRRDGASGVSVRTVAAEAGLSTGSLRHSFPSRIDLVAHATALVAERTSARIRSRRADPDARRRAVRVLAERLPLDDARRAEAEVTAALVAEAASHPRLREVRARAHAAARETCLDQLALLRAAGLLRPDADPEAEADHLQALVAGLALQLLVAEPDAARGARALDVLERHVDALVARRPARVDA